MNRELYFTLTFNFRIFTPTELAQAVSLALQQGEEAASRVFGGTVPAHEWELAHPSLYWDFLVQPYLDVIDEDEAVSWQALIFNAEEGNIPLYDPRLRAFLHGWDMYVTNYLASLSVREGWSNESLLQRSYEFKGKVAGVLG